MTRTLGFGAVILGSLPWVLAAGGIGCTGTPPGERLPPEICDDGADNDEDGAADCEDSDCGGLICRTTSTTTTTTDLLIAEVIYDSSECCDFDFGPEDCPEKTIGTIRIANRSSVDDGVIDASCNLVGGSVAAIRWRPDGEADSSPFLTDYLIPADTELTIEATFSCGGGINQSFTTGCIAKVEVGVFEEEENFEVNGTTATAR